MEGDAIQALRDSAKALVAKLRDGDRISIVAFHSRADILVQNHVVNAATRTQVTPGSPVGEALMGSREGDERWVTLPNGRRRILTVLAVFALV